MATSTIITGGNPKQRSKKALEWATAQSDSFDTTVFNTDEERGIEVAKQIIQKASKQPFQSKISTLVILEAQNLTLEAQNSLLKILEEPPAKTQILLTAPNSESVLATIASRCLEIMLKKEEEKEKPINHELENLSLSKKLEQAEITSIEKRIEIWEKRLKEVAINKNIDKSKLHKLHRYSKILLKLKKAENFSVNKKLLVLIS